MISCHIFYLYTGVIQGVRPLALCLEIDRCAPLHGLVARVHAALACKAQDPGHDLLPQFGL